MSNNKTTADSADKIAIVGMACRFPGDVASPEDYWRVLSEGRDVVTEVGEERFGADFYQHPNRKEPGKSVTFAAGMLSDIDQFDAAFFGISPREAEQMDPQQRLLLELSWEALEDGGQVPEKLSGSDCAVYVGIASTDYLNRRVDDPASMDAYTMTGNTASVASNRISYIYNLHGPSVSVDTACSSSLVAIHQACQAIRSGESGMAIAGGVNMLLHPFAFVGFSQASMLSERGRCRTFDASGDGYVRAEGAAILILKPLKQAEAAGDVIHGVIVASGINSDGRTNGITVPSSNQQGALLRKVYAQAGVSADDLVYLEAHGTGTAVGDPIEIRAIGEVLGQARTNKVLPIGSVKSNLGHLETASGMAGLIKALLTLKHQAIPPSLHIETLNPKIDFDAHNLSVVRELTPLATTGQRQLVGINSFGFGGANAHVLVERYLEPARSARDVHDTELSVDVEADTQMPPLFLSAHSETALAALAGRYAERLMTGVSYQDVAWSAAQHRQHLMQGMIVEAADREEMRSVLQQIADGNENNKKLPGVTTGELVEHEAQLAWVFSGNGSQWQGMGQVLIAHSTVFHDAIVQVDELLSHYVDYSLQAEFAATKEHSRLHLTEVAQPMLFAFQVGVVQVLRALGVKPAAVIGHSVGEVAAAWASGALSLEQAVWVIYERSHAQSKTAGQGRMAAAGLGPDAVKEKLVELGLQDKVEIAGINSPNAVTLSAALDDLEALGGLLSHEGVFFRVLALDYAFHSHRMDSIQAGLTTALSDLRPVAKDEAIRFVSTVKGETVEPEQLDANYWWENIRQPVLFEAGLNTLIDSGVQVFLEIGPNAILQSYIKDCLRDKNKPGKAVPLVSRKQEQPDGLRKAAYATWLMGCKPDWQAYFPTGCRFVALPAYPWQRERYWYPLTTDGYNLVNRRRTHPLLGYRLKDVEAGWENQLDTEVVPYLADHIVDGVVVIPAAAYVEMALAASSQWYQTTTHVVEDCEIRAPVLLDPGQAKSLRFNLNPDDGSFKITSRERLSEDAWHVNVVGRLTGKVLKTADEVAFEGLDSLKNRAKSWVSAEQHYHYTDAVGLSYLPAFQTVQQVWVIKPSAKALAKLAVPMTIESGADEHWLHPTLLDGAFQTLVDVFYDGLTTTPLTALIPTQVGRLNFFDPQSASTSISYVQLTVKKRSPRSAVVDFLLLGANGEVLVELLNCRFRAMQFARSQQRSPDLYEFVPWLKPLRHDRPPSPELAIDSLLAQARKVLSLRESELQRSRHYTQIVPLLEVLATRYAWDAAQALSSENTLSVAKLMAHGQLAAPQQPLFRRLLDRLVDSGLAQLEISVSGDPVWALAETSDLPPAQAIWLAILGDSPAHVPELVMLGRCGEHLPAVLRGQISPAELLAPAKSSIRDHWLDSSPGFRTLNLLMTEWVRQAVVAWPVTQRIRILEIGGGNGSLAHRLLPLLPAERCDYVLTDPVAERIAQIEAEFDDYPFLQALTLDMGLNDEIYQQLQSEAAFDLLLVSNALLDWPDVVANMRQLRRLLNANGTLLLANIHDSRFLDLTCGIDPAWWSQFEAVGPEDDEGSVSRLLSNDEWSDVLRQTGFESIRQIVEPEAEAAEQTDGAYLMLAIAEGATYPTAAAPSILHRDAANAGDQAIKAIKLAEQWLIIADDRGFSAEVAENLRHRLQGEGFLVTLQQHFSLQHQYDHIVHLAGLSGTGADVSSQPESASVAASDRHIPVSFQDRRCISTLELVKTLDKQDGETKLWLVTVGAMPAAVAAGSLNNLSPVTLIQPEQATLWGLGRVVMNEHPDLNCTLIDLQEAVSADQAADWLFAECLQADGENEILLRQDARSVLRMQQTTLAPAVPNQQQKPAAVSLDFSAPGPLKNLYWKALPDQVLQDDEIEILPHASGLNFRDVMYAMGLLSDEAVENGFAGAALGMELSGVVVRTGKAVANFKVGDAVIGFAPACFSTRVITRTTAVAHKPPSWTDAEAATVPTTFFTVYYALHHLAHLEEGDRILIHGASGGVGLAAIQFARYRGAEVFATAGTDEKREFVRLMGADHVMDSRSLNFAEDVLRLTDGQGVDIILNSISGEAINKNLSILRPFGRFLELGKRDFYENSKIGLRPFRNNITYFGIDADQLLVERPGLAGRLFREMMALFEEGVLRPLPHRVFSATRIQEAFRYMQQSRQIGKVIVSFEGVSLQPTFVEPAPVSLQLPAEASYLVTGGLSGFGLRTAQWLVEKGARTLVLISRRGLEGADDTTQQVLAELKARGVHVTVRACDVTDYAAMQQLFVHIDKELPPLKGIIHAAMVLDDAIIRNMEADSFRAVLAPKVLGAEYLHQLSSELQLDFFALYSSVTTYLGNPGQANYVAANMYLESLTALRLAQGLPAVFAAWGPLDDTGYLAREQETKEALQSRLGGHILTSVQALHVFEQLLCADKPGVAVIDMDWNVVKRSMPAARAPKYAEQCRLAGATDEGDQGDDITALIAGLSAAEVHELVTGLLIAEVGEILRLPREKLATDKSVFDLGMDSLMGMELVLAIEDKFAVRLPVMALTEGATVSRIAEKIADQLLARESGSQTAATPAEQSAIADMAAETVRKHGSDMSAEQLERLVDDVSGVNKQ